MILYVIQAHKDVERIVELVEFLFSDESTCLVNLDPNISDQISRLNALFAATSVGRSVIVRTGIPVNWGGISQVHAFLDVLQYALSLDVKWDFLINLSGDSVPLVPQHAIRRFYLKELREGRRVHFSLFGPRHLPNATGFAPSNFTVLPWGQAQGFTASYRNIRFHEKVAATLDSGLDPIFRANDTNPVFRTRLRGSLHVSDLMIERRLVIRRLLPSEADYRVQELGKMRLYGGRAWYTLARSATEDIVADSITWTILRHLEHYLCPDELFLQSCVLNSKRFTHAEIGLDNHRFRRGDGIRIDDALADELFSSASFFARKVQFERCPTILNRLRKVILDHDSP